MFFKGEYAFLSNMLPCRVEHDGIVFQSSEAAYQAAKCANRAERILFAKLNGYEAKKMGRRVRVRADWNDVRIDIMRAILKAKFADPALMAKLKSTPGLIEETNTWNDRFWGVCNGSGENMLGKLLMEIRDAA